MWSHRTRLRLLAWAGIPLLVVTRVLVSVLVDDAQLQFILSDTLTYLLPMLLAAVMCTVLAALYRTTVEERFWGLLGGAATALFISEVYWDWYVLNVDPIGPPFENGRMFFTAGSAVLFSALLVTMTRLNQRPPAMRARFLIDSFAGMVLGYAVIYSTWTYPLIQGFPDSVRIAGWIAAWPVFGVTMGLVTLAIMAGYKAYRWRPWERLVTTACIVFALGLVALPIAYAQAMTLGFWETSWYNAVLGAALYLLFVAGVYRLTAGTEEALAQPWPVPAGRPWIGIVYPVALAASLPLFGIQASQLAGYGAETPVVVSAVLLAALLGLRSWIAVFEAADERVRAVTDPLTGAYSAAYLSERTRWAEEYPESVVASPWLISCRIDDFGRVDHIFGREAGDVVLRATVGALKAAAPVEAEVFRVADSEFLAVLPPIDRAAALDYCDAVAFRLRSPEGTRAVLPPFGVSFGLARLESGDPAGLGVERARLAAALALHEDEPVHVYRSGDEIHGASADHGRSRTLQSAMFALAQASDAREATAPNHSIRVARLATALAERAGFEGERLREVRNAALLHDVGKIGVGATVLSRAGALTSSEREMIERHAELGDRLLRTVGMPAIATIVRHHHERWDGTGYPDGLAGDSIPIESRILSLCDVAETLTAPHAYRDALTVEEAQAEIAASAGSQFDPDLAALLVGLLSEGGLMPADAGVSATGGRLTEASAS